eukprot:scaffold1690_cov182-Amphora_coffeaeformis.AAC.55
METADARCYCTENHSPRRIGINGIGRTKRQPSIITNLWYRSRTDNNGTDVTSTRRYPASRIVAEHCCSGYIYISVGSTLSSAS